MFSQFPIFAFVNYTLLIKGAEYMPLTKLQITNIKILKSATYRV